MHLFVDPEKVESGTNFISLHLSHLLASHGTQDDDTWAISGGQQAGSILIVCVVISTHTHCDHIMQSNTWSLNFFDLGHLPSRRRLRRKKEVIFWGCTICGWVLYNHHPITQREKKIILTWSSHHYTQWRHIHFTCRQGYLSKSQFGCSQHHYGILFIFTI